MGATGAEPSRCRLDQAVGFNVPCPEDSCPFWEPGRAVLEGRCVFEGIDFREDRDVAWWLLGFRKRLAGSSGV